MIQRWLASLAFVSLVTLATVFALAPAARAATVVTMTNSGPAANRIDVIILGDGYRATEMAKFRADATIVADRLMAVQPLATYRSSFNITRIETASVQSGAGRGTARNTVYGAYYNCFRIQRLLCINEAKVTAMISANLASNRRDIVVVIVNDAEYGGSGGRYAVASMHPAATDIMIHELGHSFGHLDDEYIEDASCGRYTNPWGFNVSRASTRTGVPWSRWIASNTPVPTPIGFTGPGVFQGAFFCTNGWYRPTADSMMRTLGLPFGPVNSEQLVRRHYEMVSLIDRRSPAAASVRLPSTGVMTFRVVTANAGAATPSIVWRLAGRFLGTGPSITINRAALNGATRSLVATVAVKTPLVRSDPRGVLIDTTTWSVAP